MYVLHAKLMHHGLLFINKLLPLHKLPMWWWSNNFSHLIFIIRNNLLFLYDSICLITFYCYYLNSFFFSFSFFIYPGFFIMTMNWFSLKVRKMKLSRVECIVIFHWKSIKVMYGCINGNYCITLTGFVEILWES